MNAHDHHPHDDHPHDDHPHDDLQHEAHERGRPRRVEGPDRSRRDVGQATTEYALILLGAALVGLLVVAWATAGGAAGRIGQLFDAVVDSVISRL